MLMFYKSTNANSSSLWLACCLLFNDSAWEVHLHQKKRFWSALFGQGINDLFCSFLVLDFNDTSICNWWNDCICSSSSRTSSSDWAEFYLRCCKIMLQVLKNLSLHVWFCFPWVIQTLMFLESDFIHSSLVNYYLLLKKSLASLKASKNQRSVILFFVIKF